MPGLTGDEKKKVIEASKKEMSLKEGNFRGKVIVHLGTCGIAAGAREVMDALFEEVNKRDIIDIMFSSSGCAGLCSKEPIITVEIGPSTPVKYGKLTPEKVLKILDQHIIGGQVVNEFAIGMGSERVG